VRLIRCIPVGRQERSSQQLVKHSTTFPSAHSLYWPFWSRSGGWHCNFNNRSRNLIYVYVASSIKGRHWKTQYWRTRSRRVCFVLVVGLVIVLSHKANYSRTL